MQTLAQIKTLLAERGLAPRKHLGQNFLIDHNLIRRLVDTSGVGAGDLVLEVGPGTGTLTEALLARGCRVIAGELDAGLAGLVAERLGGPSLSLVVGDALDTSRGPAAHDAPADHPDDPPRVSAGLVAALGDEPFTLVANLPYGAGTGVMLALMTRHAACRGQFVTIQREVADRLTSRPGGRDYGPLAVVAGALCRVNRIATLPPECFWPRPEVTSVMVAIGPRADRPVIDGVWLARWCRRVFAGRRKQLGSALRPLVPAGFSWPRGISPTQRAETLTADQVIALGRAIGFG